MTLMFGISIYFHIYLQNFSLLGFKPIQAFGILLSTYMKFATKDFWPFECECEMCWRMFSIWKDIVFFVWSANKATKIFISFFYTAFLMPNDEKKIEGLEQRLLCLKKICMMTTTSYKYKTKQQGCVFKLYCFRE